MTANALTLPTIASQEEWLAARKSLLSREKEFTRLRDQLNMERRRLPMVEVTKAYVFEGLGGRAGLHDLFEGRRQLIIYHFMLDADDPPPSKSGAPWDEGCPGCSHLADNIPPLAHLHARNTSLAMVSRARLPKITTFKTRMGWTMPWYSSFGSEFNYDFHVTMDETRGSIEWNYASPPPYPKGELPGLSVFLRDGTRVFHSYSTYARGLDMLLNVHHYLDLTPFGRGEGWDGMPDLDGEGLHWLRHRDRYQDVAAKPCHSPISAKESVRG